MSFNHSDKFLFYYVILSISFSNWQEIIILITLKYTSINYFLILSGRCLIETHLYFGDLLQTFTERIPELIEPVKKVLIDTLKFIKTRSNTTYAQTGMVKNRILELKTELILCSNNTSSNLHVSQYFFSLKTNQDCPLKKLYYWNYILTTTFTLTLLKKMAWICKY